MSGSDNFFNLFHVNDNSEYDPLTLGTALVAGTGVLFDLWVSVFMVDGPNLPKFIIRIITAVFVIILLYGVSLMYIGWQDGRKH